MTTSFQQSLSIYRDNSATKPETTENIISWLNAKSIYEKHVKDVGNNTITSVQGEFGVGKSTTKKYLIERIKDKVNKSICVEYNALQYEEAGQITSQFYTAIGTKLSICNRLKLYACAILKKENPNASYITGNLGIFGIFSAIITLILYYVNKSIFEQINTNYVFIILLFILGMIFIFRNDLVEIFSSLLPRKSHVQILEGLDTTEFKDTSLFIFVDELDRIDAKSLQLLLNEVLILHEILDSIKIQHKLFLFYNLNSVRNILSKSDIADVDFYLQKYIHNGFKIYKPDFSHALHSKIYNCIQKENPISINSGLTNLHIFAKIGLQNKKQVPSSEILTVINKNLLSFRDLDRFVVFLLTNAYGISNALMSDFNLNSVELDDQFKVDITTIVLFFDYKYQINLHDLSLDIKSIQQNKVIYNLLLDFEKVIQTLYGSSILRDSELKAQISAEANKNLLTAELNHISLRYSNDSRIYPSTINNGKVNFNIDRENNLEYIFIEYNYQTNKGSSLIDYIEANLSEFYTSRQAGYPYLDHLSSTSLLLNETNFDDFMEFILALEKRLVLFLQQKYKTFIFTTKYATNLYDAAINSIIYCLTKLLPSDPEKFNKIINLFTTYINTQPHFSSLLFYLGLSRVASRYYPAFAANRDNILKLLDQIEISEINFHDNEFNFLFLYEYFDTIRKRNNYQTNPDLTIDSHGNLRIDKSGFIGNYSAGGIVDKLTCVLTSIDVEDPIETSYYGLFFVMGLLFYSKSQNMPLKKEDLLIGGIKNTIKPWAAPIITRTIEYKNKQCCKDMIEILNLFK